MTGPAYIERRDGVELRAAGSADAPRLVGLAAPFDRPSRDLGGFVETIKPGAFTRTLAAGPDIPLMRGHDAGQVFARTVNDTLALHETARGLEFEAELADTRAARDLYAEVKRGDMRHVSIGFRVPRGGDAWLFPDGDAPAHRTLSEVELLEISLVGLAGYGDTAVAARALADHRDTPLRRFTSLWRAYYEQAW